MNEGPPPGRVRITSTEGWLAAAVDAIEEPLTRALRSVDGPVHIGLSGGATPRPVYRALAERGQVDWGRVVVLPADERFVPEGDPDSNHGMIRDALSPEAGQRLRMPFFGRIEGRGRPETAGALADALPPHLDLLVLGIGEDGHTGSLFPGDPRLLQFGLLEPGDSRSGRSGPGTAGSTLTVVDSPKPPVERVSITPAVIASARAIVVLARGTGKAEAVGRALRGLWDPVGTPGQWARSGSWVLDPAAASAL